jgi:hypothetical protein
MNIKNDIKLKLNNCCNSKACIDIINEIDSLKLEEKNLQHKINVLDYNKAQQLIELTERISELNDNISNLMKNVEKYNKENFTKIGYFDLSDLEKNLMILLTKVKRKINEKELKYLTKQEKFEVLNNCIICQNEKVDTILLPCFHLIACILCGPFITFCPECNIKVESYEKIYTN